MLLIPLEKNQERSRKPLGKSPDAREDGCASLSGAKFQIAGHCWTILSTAPYGDKMALAATGYPASVSGFNFDHFVKMSICHMVSAGPPAAAFQYSRVSLSHR